MIDTIENIKIICDRFDVDNNISSNKFVSIYPFCKINRKLIVYNTEQLQKIENKIKKSGTKYKIVSYIEKQSYFRDIVNCELVFDDGRIENKYFTKKTEAIEFNDHMAVLTCIKSVPSQNYPNIINPYHTETKNIKVYKCQSIDIFFSNNNIWIDVVDSRSNSFDKEIKLILNLLNN